MTRPGLIVLSVLLASLALQLPDTQAKKGKKPIKEPDFRREEMMMINLNQGPKSANFYLLGTLKSTRQTEKDLARAASQMEQAGSAFARAKGLRDGQPLSPALEQIKQAQQKAQELEEKLETARKELKENVRTTLISH